ncbi:MAG TPA: NAD(P)-dependent oxidoreductase [Vicinamibacterales bacterium]|nr:NAD(P)-dependent oxidoreductase [Vicinamibacterales bacterium]
MRITFFGLGNMGQGMARNLLNAKFDLTVWNRTASRADGLVEAGAKRASSVAEASHADIAVTMVADDGALEHIVFTDGMLDALPSGAIHVSMSTISVRLAKRLAAAHAERGSLFVSAPVFGRPEAAAAAKLFVIAAGPEAALDRCQPLFDALGQRTFRLGAEPSAANVVKLSGNFLLVASIECLAEAIALARKEGLDPHRFVEVLTTSVFTAPFYKVYGTLIADERYRPAGFSLSLGLKDVTLALNAAHDRTVALPVASLVRDRIVRGLAQGEGDADWSVLGALAARDAGLE